MKISTNKQKEDLFGYAVVGSERHIKNDYWQIDVCYEKDFGMHGKFALPINFPKGNFLYNIRKQKEIQNSLAGAKMSTVHGLVEAIKNRIKPMNEIVRMLPNDLLFNNDFIKTTLNNIDSKREQKTFLEDVDIRRQKIKEKQIQIDQENAQYQVIIDKLSAKLFGEETEEETEYQNEGTLVTL